MDDKCGPRFKGENALEALWGVIKFLSENIDCTQMMRGG